MGTMQGRVASAFLGAPGTLRKDNQTSLEFAFDGIVGDRHRGLTRKAWALTDKQPEGTERRNERQWSAVAQDDLDVVSEKLNLVAPLAAGDVAVNLSIEGVPDFSRLPRGTTLSFAGGVVLLWKSTIRPAAVCRTLLPSNIPRAMVNPWQIRTSSRRQSFAGVWWA